MPKKFVSENTKAVAAKTRKAVAKEMEAVKKQKEVEDEYWKDDNKNLQRKQQRKEEREKKKQGHLEKKAENKAMLEEEYKSIKLSPRGVSKITQSQIQLEMEKRKILPPKAVKVETHLDMPLEENINRIVVDGEVACTVNEAIAVLSVNEPVVDKHPEKRVRNAYNTFEETNMPRVKAENPTLRLSQLRQLLRKEWLKSEENPMNQTESHDN